jgi:hypothetical protein
LPPVQTTAARRGGTDRGGWSRRPGRPRTARLEAETGSRLIQRVGRGIRLTEAGRLPAERAEEILGRLAAASEELATYTGLRAGPGGCGGRRSRRLWERSCPGRRRAVGVPGSGRRVGVAVLGEPPDPPGTAALLTHLRAAAGGT